jgi:predicted HTH transcriptional regulator
MTHAKYNAFIKGLESGKFETDKLRIYKLLEKEPMTLDMLVLRGIKKETASARISDLMDLGVVKAIGQKISFFQVVKDEKEIKELRRNRSRESYLKWLKKGESNGWL